MLRGVGYELVRPFPHRGEAGRGDEVGQAIFVDLDLESSSDAPHLAFEIVLQIRVVDEDNVRSVAYFPEGCEMMHGRREIDVRQLTIVRAVDPVPEACERIGRRRFPVAQHLREILVPDRTVASGEQRYMVDVVLEVRPRQGNVARIAPDADVGDRRVEVQPVEWRVRLDEAAMLLRVEVGDHLADVARLHVEPGRDEIERSIEGRALKDEQRTDHLHPRGAALRRSADDDVARTRGEPLPADAVHHR